MKITLRELAEIGEKSPGYTICVRQADGVYTLANIRFLRFNGKIRRNSVECVSTRPDGQSKLISCFPWHEVDLID